MTATEEPTSEPEQRLERLQRALARAGVASRRASEELIAGLDVLVNAGEYAVLRPLRQDLVVEANA